MTPKMLRLTIQLPAETVAWLRDHIGRHNMAAWIREAVWEKQEQNIRQRANVNEAIRNSLRRDQP